MWLLILLVGATALTGCSTTKHYQAEKLPPHLMAPPLENAQTIDLTKLATATTTQDLIGAGDVIEVSISAGLAATDTTTFPVRVTDDGAAQLPMIGNVELAGMNLEESEAIIAGVCVDKGLYRAPHVTVTMKRPKLHRITVLGAVEEPATYELRAGQSDVLQAIVAAGGLSKDAGVFVQVRHPGYRGESDGSSAPLIAELDPESGVQTVSNESKVVQPIGMQTVRVNLASAATERPETLRLNDGGIVMVERRDPKPIHVLGLVKKPNRYEFPISEDLRLLDAVSLASGTDNPLADKVYIIRNTPGSEEPTLIEASLRKAKRNGRADLRLAPGDIVSVEQTPTTALYEAVRLIGFGISGRVF
ncbi:polysaccharide biosynthesis/export family protein [Rubinisphaera margarita]|uniref:polysaccharide biosynthesis/export family protein n=1 Tax=Rubinisphaera margarita TaxID=2909586 RepID=UPI001EE8702F|nr:polysaccharide biosynthesis/export family protein [Rubinisphaera margarita]MCG6154446.1 polysaccharide biosynthesis/export family protein [Rubinisphaera margarita]